MHPIWLIIGVGGYFYISHVCLVLNLRKAICGSCSSEVILVDFEAVVRKRRMCREYLNRDVSSEKIDRVLGLASRTLRPGTLNRRNSSSYATGG